ncbi:hypothetical protein DFH06DRAFT_512039 [Mycena polygramma]|nr:hypothetical protein DFH06DRAFT_512039 [Mycena polygramma]
MYFADTLQSYYGHRIETIQGRAPASLVQGRTVSAMLADAYSFLVFYHVAKAVIAEFPVVQARYPDGPARARELPQDYEDALKRLHPLLGLLEDRITKGHHQTICASEAVRPGITIRSTDPTFRHHEIGFASRFDDKLYTFMTILLQEQQTFLWQVSRVFDQLDRVTQDPAAHRRVSPLIASLLSQWGVVNDCKSILEWHRPAVERTEELHDGVKQRLQKWIPLLEPVLPGLRPDPQLSARAFPVSSFIYPKGPRNSAWAGKCTDVDKVFAAFWKTADRVLLEKFGREVVALGTRLVEPFAIAPTDWAAIAAPKVTVRPKPAPEALIPFGGAEQISAVKEEVATAAKRKAKTRGVPMTAAEEPQSQQIREQPTVPPTTAVSAKAYKVLSTLFNAAKDEEVALQQSSVAWKDIQATFVHLGFELHKTRGSAWTFEHSDGPKSVTVHEPHPESTMRFWDVRRFGRRLTKRFGWTLESFVPDLAPQQVVNFPCLTSGYKPKIPRDVRLSGRL